MPERITGHVFRAFADGKGSTKVCAFMNCRRPAVEHARVWRPRSRQRTSASAL